MTGKVAAFLFLPKYTPHRGGIVFTSNAPAAADAKRAGAVTAPRSWIYAL